MKKVCSNCGSNHLHKHGKKRRKCADCGKTCSIKSGRKKTRIHEMYILDRSTYRRIGTKEHTTHVAQIKRVMNELIQIPHVIVHTKNFAKN